MPLKFGRCAPMSVPRRILREFLFEGIDPHVQSPFVSLAVFTSWPQTSPECYVYLHSAHLCGAYDLEIGRGFTGN